MVNVTRLERGSWKGLACLSTAGRLVCRLACVSMASLAIWLVCARMTMGGEEALVSLLGPHAAALGLKQ
jgi:hypothetical protein